MDDSGAETAALARRRAKDARPERRRDRPPRRGHRPAVPGPLLFDAYCGLRLSELAGLRRSSVDLAAGTVRVTENAVEVRGEIHWGKPKTRAGRRTVPIRWAIRGELARHLATFAEPSPDGLVFPGANGGVLRAGPWRSRFFRPAVRKAGLDGLRPHDLRHTAVAMWIAAGANPKQIATWAGHTSVSVVLDRYGHLFEGHETVVLDRLDTFIEVPPVPAGDGECRGLSAGRPPARSRQRQRNTL